MNTLLHFTPVTYEDAPLLRRYYADCNYRLCEYSAGVHLMWKNLHSAYTEVSGCLVIRTELDGRICFCYPVPGADGNEDAALAALEQDCCEKERPLEFMAVPEEKLADLVQRYPVCRVRNFRVWQDYLYRAEDMQHFRGRHYSGQRNHIHRFFKLFPEARFRPLTAEDHSALESFWQSFETEFRKAKNEDAVRELALAQDLFRHYAEDWLCAGCMELHGQIIGIALGERCGETMMVHIEKAFPDYEGIYPALVQAFAQTFGEGLFWFNREDDSADKGLRTSKLQYLPGAMGANYALQVENESFELDAVPTLQTQRLTLRAFTEADIPAYNALCLDDGHNRWWGYDYREDLSGALTEDWFFRVTQEDFRKHTAVNFAVELDGQCIGEAILYRFDFRGGAELGCRISPQYAGRHYGAEAFDAVTDWALYELGLKRVKAKCFRENEASRRMLSARMRRIGEDETFFYYETQI